jgi:hypothetical protein
VQPLWLRRRARPLVTVLLGLQHRALALVMV